MSAILNIKGFKDNKMKKTNSEKIERKTAKKSRKSPMDTSSKQKKKSPRKTPHKKVNPFITVLKFIRDTYRTIGVILLTLVILFGALFYHFENFYNECRDREYDALASLVKNPFKQIGESVIYDKDGNVIARLHNTGYRYTKIADISKELQETYISSEDKDFKTHPGFSVKGIARAALQYIKNNGRITQGGSTITQQLVKNTLLSNEKTFNRKLTEIFLAIDLEKKYSKADIMEYYLNTCFYGNNCTGIYAASEYYFGKTPAELDYCESAMLAAISKSPSVNNPIANKDRAMGQRNIVLKALLDDEKITQKQYKEYCSTDYTEIKHESKAEKSDYKTSFAVYCASLELMKNNGFKFQYTFKSKKSYNQYKKSYSEAYNATSQKIRAGGYRIYTSLSSKKQAQMQNVIDKKLNSVSTDKAKDGRFKTQGAAVCIDNKTGLVCAIVGGRGEKDEYNRAFLSTRQPGSSIKPVLDYAPAFDTGKFYPSRIYNDREIKNGPKNSNGSKSSGKISIRNAIKISSNTVAFNVLKDIGVSSGLNYLEKMRFSSLSDIDNNSLSLSIGGFTNGVKVYEMAGAYAALENNGAWRTPTCITEIDNTVTGEKVKNKQKGIQVYEDSSAFMITDCLKDVFDNGGTGHGLAVKGQECAGKTGTTNSMKDGWFCGYTPYYTLAVWVGNDDGSLLYHNYGATYAGPIWKEYMDKIHKGLRKISFVKPSTVERKYIGAWGSPASSGTQKDYFAVKKTVVAVNTAEESAEKERERAVLKELKRYEDLYPDTEWTYYQSTEIYDSINSQLAGLSNDSVRSEYQDRLEKKEQYIEDEKTHIDNFNLTKNEYEKEKAEKQRKKEEKEQRQKQKEKRISSAIGRFNDAIGMIYNTDDKSVMTDALKTAKENLEELAELDDYSDYSDKYESARDYIQNYSEDQETDLSDE